MNPTHKTQLYLDETRYQFLAQWARQRGESIAQAVRDLIDECMNRTAKNKNRRDPFWKAVGLGQGDGERVAENYEDFLYGKR